MSDADDVAPGPSLTSVPSTAPRPPSLAPLVVVVAFFVIAITLVLVGAQRSAAPAPSIRVERPGTPDQPRAVTVLMRDYVFDPNPLVVVAGETIRLTAFGAGMVSHELVLGDAAVQEAWASADAAHTPPAPFATAPPASVPPETGGVRALLSPGEQASVDFLVPVSGRLELVCHLPGHQERGMIGQVEVRHLPPTGSSPSGR